MKLIETRFAKYNRNSSQDGITLVISIVMLAAVTFVSFALSAIIIREIGVARVILRTEPAISAANSGGEVAMYQLFRGSGNIPTSGEVSQNGTTYQIVTNLYNDNYFFQASGGQQISVALYDPANPDSKITNFDSYTITNDAGSQPIQTSVVSWSDADHPFCIQTIPNGSSPYTCDELNRPDDRYVIYIQPQGGPTKTSTGQITAQDKNDEVIGIPADYPTLDITGSSNGVQRKIQIRF